MTKQCGCNGQIIRHTSEGDPYTEHTADIEYCPLHGAAGEMLEALEEAEVYLDDDAPRTALDIIRAAIKKVKGGAP